MQRRALLTQQNGDEGPPGDLTLGFPSVPVCLKPLWGDAGNILQWRCEYVLTKCMLELHFTTGAFFLPAGNVSISAQIRSCKCTHHMSHALLWTHPCLRPPLQSAVQMQEIHRGTLWQHRGERNPARSTNMTAGIPAISECGLCQRELLCSWSCELANVCWGVVIAHENSIQPRLLEVGLG